MGAREVVVSLTPASAASGYLVASEASFRNPLGSSKLRLTARREDACERCRRQCGGGTPRAGGAHTRRLGSRSTDDGHEGHDGASTPPIIDLVQYLKTVLDS